MSMRTLVGFYGLNRSLRWTAASINKNVIAPLRGANVDVRCAAHFNEPGLIHDERSGELGIAIDRTGIGLLPLDALTLEKQEEGRLPATVLQAISDLPERPTVAPRQTMLNLLWQLYSLNQLWKLIHVTRDRHDAYIFLRPDMEYLDPLDPSVLTRIASGEVDLITASWGKWGGLNDRFAICSPTGAEVYAQRISGVERLCADEGYLHGEPLLKSVAERANLRLGYTDVRAMRVRADGGTVRGEFDISAYQLVRGIARKRVHRIRTLLGMD
jgi:hypothetical protein